jgi:hypothetical protein
MLGYIHWIYMPQDGDLGRAFVLTVINLLVS